ncbi:hypothetical protein QR685DRAFT_511260 [Neurospora intermedia]|uniref:Uncharacterized protein n=1 Tax=Neurospora intermedia TaxID=5142 RepID=A0ABR3DQP2_NEUIN
MEHPPGTITYHNAGHCRLSIFGPPDHQRFSLGHEQAANLSNERPNSCSTTGCGLPFGRDCDRTTAVLRSNEPKPVPG